MARFALGAKCGGFSAPPADGAACPFVSEEYASPRNPRAPSRLAIAAHPNTFPERPRNCLRVSSVAHSCFRPTGIARSITPGPCSCSVSVQRGCCFMCLPLLLIHGLIEVQHFARHHGPRREFRRGNGRIALLLAHANKIMSRFGVGGIMFLHLCQRTLKHCGHARRWIVR